MDQRALNNLSLCSGGGGLDLGLELAVGTTRTVCWVEWEAFAAEFLASRMEKGCLPPAPVWTDLRTFDGHPWRGVVDSITAGYPCQPFSLAGQRRGQDDPRHLWPHIARVIGEVEPSIVFAENVAGHLSLGAEQVIANLQGLGYEVAAGLFTAAEVGASHQRERLFILGVVHDPGQRRRQGRTESDVRLRRRAAPGPGRPLADPAPELHDRQRQQRPPGGPQSAIRGGSLEIAHDGRSRPQRRQVSSHFSNKECWSERREPFPPRPQADWSRIPTHFWPATESGFCELVDGLAVDRARWLRLFGNGVVPLQAAYAFLSLWSCLGSRSGCLNSITDEMTSPSEPSSPSE